jgi:hypothetical protein
MKTGESSHDPGATAEQPRLLPAGTWRGMAQALGESMVVLVAMIGAQKQSVSLSDVLHCFLTAVAVVLLGLKGVRQMVDCFRPSQETSER